MSIICWLIWYNKLMTLDIDFAGLTIDDLKHFHVRIELSPLMRPVSTDVLFSDDSIAFRSLWSTDVLTHQNVLSMSCRLNAK
ncbi:hypothetical protein ACKFKG_09865 [Phormidesmis sp. 146-35]